MENRLVSLEINFEDDLYTFSDPIKSQIKPFTEYILAPIFKDEKKLNIEIGIGNGEFITHFAKERVDENFIGFEVYRKIFRKAIDRVKKNGLKNVKLIQFDASFFVPLLKDNSVSNFYINFPDPWPKKKHNRRRLLKDSFLKVIKDKLVTGGNIYIATDHDDYAADILKNLKVVEELHPKFESYFVNELVDYYPTKYYRKFAIHSKVYFFRMEKI
ncbi:MAG: tRNA (guanosine(46)-N7)-methyltransferase TrmB [Calditerrivibrio sp.]|nr:tRNA (guanosine(46)-N7)-methyltransferase TrmB [Calditerrivibrio sp.]MCA1933156.1 tRNA (guanosine(46)-N7)-methyltransferase TrmB [Calditerrivibrio sp.]MCA1980689.1 tRNA (guanosine(46)-N7)-methyltransferase TrmB [Calditerrivibrio sp.]